MTTRRRHLKTVKVNVTKLYNNVGPMDTNRCAEFHCDRCNGLRVTANDAVDRPDKTSGASLSFVGPPGPLCVVTPPGPPAAAVAAVGKLRHCIFHKFMRNMQSVSIWNKKPSSCWDGHISARGKHATIFILIFKTFWGEPLGLFSTHLPRMLMSMVTVILECSLWRWAHGNFLTPFSWHIPCINKKKKVKVVKVIYSGHL